MKLIKKVMLCMVVVALAIGTLACKKPDDDLKGVTDTTIYVGNTAGTTGVLATIGVPFNLGIRAAFAKYNAAGGYTGLDEKGKQLETGLNVALKHYDDGGTAENASTLMNTLLYDDEVFGIVGNYGSYAVNVNLDIIKEAGAPMVYAAAGNDELFNENARGEDRGIFPVQPLNITEGKMLIARAFAPAVDAEMNLLGGLGATKVGVITSSVTEASVGITSGIRAEANNLSAAQRANITYTSVNDGNFATAATTIKEAECDVVIITGIGAEFISALTALANSNVTCKVLTSYNNASADVFNDSTTKLMQTQYQDIFTKMTVYAQAWLDITSTNYIYNEDTPLNAAYRTMMEGLGLPYTGTAGFNEEYWEVAEAIYDYAASLNDSTINPLIMSYNSYALAGYIAGDLFCKGLEALEESGKALTRKNYIDVMEETELFDLSMADTISFNNGVRVGVNQFALTQILDLYTPGVYEFHQASSATIHGLTSLEEYRELIAG